MSEIKIEDMGGGLLIAITVIDGNQIIYDPKPVELGSNNFRFTYNFYDSDKKLSRRAFNTLEDVPNKYKDICKKLKEKLKSESIK